MGREVDLEGEHLAALRRLADFRGRRVLEIGCGEGRLTKGIAADAAHVFAFDPDPARIEQARASLPALADRVTWAAAGAKDVPLDRASWDIALFSWSL